MAGNDAAPGYATPAARLEQHAGLTLGRFLSAGFGLTLAAFAEGVVRQPAAYLLPGSSPSLLSVRALALGFGLAVATLAWRKQLGFRALSWGLAGLSCSLAAAGALWFVSFSAGQLAVLCALLVPLSIAGSAGLALAAALRALGSAARSLEVLHYLIQPFRALLALGLLLGCAGLGGRLGMWRSAAALGLCAALLGVYLPTLRAYLYGQKSSLRAQLPAWLGLALSCASLVLARSSLPSDELGRYPGEIVFTSHGPEHYVVTSVQQSFEIYRGNVLRIASVDAKRYAECLVHPALALAPHRSHVLVLGAADGLTEREVLAYPDVAHVTTLSDDSSLARLAQNNVFFANLSEHSLRSPRLGLVEAEPLVWLTTHAARFDVIVVDLPDPSDFAQGKHYTHYFYEQLRAHLNPGGVFVTQATSSAASPGSYSSIAASVASAGFHAQSYAAAIPTLGEWAFVLASVDALPRALSPLAREVLARSSYVNAAKLELMLAAPPPRDPDAPVNTLPEQPVVELLNNERHARGL